MILKIIFGLTSLPCLRLPNSLKELIDFNCSYNKLINLPNLSNSIILDCSDNQLTSLPNFPILKGLSCRNDKLISVPNLNMLTSFKGNIKVEYVDYNTDYGKTKINFYSYYYDRNKINNSYIEIKDYGKITSRKEYIQYMEKLN